MTMMTCTPDHAVKDANTSSRAQLEGPGTYECVLTGLIFEALERVLVVYSILSWSKFNALVQNPWRVAGPIFNIQTVDKDPSALKSIQLPHSLCLAGQQKEKVFGVLHVTRKQPVIETVQSSGSHVKWSVSSLSPVGVIARGTEQDQHHGSVLLYEDLGRGHNVHTHTLRVYLAPSSCSWLQDIKRELESERGGCFSRVYKNTNCRLVPGTYQLLSEPGGEINPENLPFTLKETMFNGYFEACFTQPLPFKLIVTERGATDKSWSANIQQGDLENKPSIFQRLLDWILWRKSNACQTTVSLQEHQIPHPQSEPITEADSRHVRSEVSSETSAKPSPSAGFTNEVAMPVAGASAVKEPPVSHTTEMKMNSVKKNWSALIQRVTEVPSIVDDLFGNGILGNEACNNIKAAKTSQEQMRILLEIISKKGRKATSAFYDALRTHELCLLEDLEEDQGI